MTTSTDRIVIRNLQVPTVIGVYPHERTQKQTLRADLTLHTDISAAGRTDDLNKTLDYAAIAESVVSFGEQSEYELLEAFAEQLCSRVFERFQPSALDLALYKDGCIPGARGAELHIHRRRPVSGDSV
ncbi:MAG: dihydroneopterin aldolase [Natronospirillum sp.]|uniref:dihydroneopterin aldolase n=1 Tax=Natronospirillum sp. TaxID=2812955 RepID=UPI0025D657D7|nr:dihydroneopterin aldolase [Natronospirillum sp.]MCH8552491.1 dihydroneopterin aldolase [Natronospirillum sp.]